MRHPSIPPQINSTLELVPHHLPFLVAQSASDLNTKRTTGLDGFTVNSFRPAVGLVGLVFCLLVAEVVLLCLQRRKERELSIQSPLLSVNGNKGSSIAEEPAGTPAEPQEEIGKGNRPPL